MTTITITTAADSAGAASGERNAFLPVRLGEDEQSNGYVTVYLPSGTALTVRAAELVAATTPIPGAVADGDRGGPGWRCKDAPVRTSPVE